jgi:hypothetical protein
MTAFWRTFHHDGKINPAWLGWGSKPTPFHSTVSTITYKVVVYASSEMADTLPPISSLPLYVLYGYEIEKVDKKPSLVLES